MFTFEAGGHSDEPGRVLTSQYERDFLRMIINHTTRRYTTELAAGSDVRRDPQTTPHDPRSSPLQAMTKM